MLFFSYNSGYARKTELKQTLISASYASLLFLSFLPLSMGLSDSSTQDNSNVDGLNGMCPLTSNSTAIAQSMAAIGEAFAINTWPQLSSTLISAAMCAIPLNTVLQAVSFIFAGIEEKRIEFPKWQDSQEFLEKDIKEKFADENYKEYYHGGKSPSDISLEFLFTALPNNTIARPIDNGLIAAMLLAYNHHIPLELRPDDIWLTILSAFGHFVHKQGVKNTDLNDQLFASIEIGKKLVKEKQLISVDEVGSFYTSTQEDWMRFVSKITKEMDLYLRPNMTEWIVPNFSTSTKQDQFISRIMLMGTMQNYFAYRMHFACGLPKVTLRGTAKDWIKLRKKTSILCSFGGELEKWADLLLPVLDQFILSYNGKASPEFWQNIAKEHRIDNGCDTKDTFNGWAAVFSPFNAKGNFHLSIPKKGKWSVSDNEISDFIDATMQVPIQIVDSSVGESVQVFLRAGMMNPQYDAKDNIIRPTTGWTMFKDAKFKEDKENSPRPKGF